MYKRIVWFGSGLVSGVAGSWYTKRKVKKQVAKFTTLDGIKTQAAKRVRTIAKTTSDRATDYLDDAEPDAEPEVQQSSIASGVTAGRTAIERYRAEARNKFFDRRRRGNIRSVPDA